MIDKKTKSKIFNFIRLSFRQSELFQQAKENAVSPTIKGPKGGKRYICAKCKQVYSPSEIEIDHIDPIVPIGKKQKDMTIEEYTNNLYCDIKNLQALCEECHLVKSNKEKQLRKSKV